MIEEGLHEKVLHAMTREPEDEDEEPAMLSDSTLAILNQFLQEQETSKDESSRDPFAEDWGMSQVSSSPSILLVSRDFSSFDKNDTFWRASSTWQS